MSFSDVVTAFFLVAFLVHRLERFDGTMPRAAVVTLAVLRSPFSWST